MKAAQIAKNNDISEEEKEEIEKKVKRVKDRLENKDTSFIKEVYNTLGSVDDNLGDELLNMLDYM